MSANVAFCLIVVFLFVHFEVVRFVNVMYQFPLHFLYELFMSLRRSFLRCWLMLALIPTATFVLGKSSSFVEKQSLVLGSIVNI